MKTVTPAGPVYLEQFVCVCVCVVLCRIIARPLRGRAGELVSASTGRTGQPDRSTTSSTTLQSLHQLSESAATHTSTVGLEDQLRPRPVTGAVAVRYDDDGAMTEVTPGEG